MQHGIDSPSRQSPGNMLEVKRKSPAFHPTTHRPTRPGIAISCHDGERFFQQLDLHQGPRIAHVTQMPDFIRRLPSLHQTLWDDVMGIGYDEDPDHDRWALRFDPGSTFTLLFFVQKRADFVGKLLVGKDILHVVVIIQHVTQLPDRPS